MASLAEEKGTIEDDIKRELANLPPGIKPFNLNNVKIFAAPGVLNCLGYTIEHGDMEAALGARGALRKGDGVYAALTNNGLPPSYIRSEIDDDNELTDFDASKDSPINLAIAQYDTRDGNAASLRGFALLQVKNKDKIIREDQHNCNVSTATMELKVLGNKMGPGVKTRGNKIFPRGGNIIRLVQFLGSKLHRGIFLYGLETVISLYRYFGWEVTSARSAKNSDCNNTGTMVTRQKAIPTLAGEFFKKYGADVDIFNATQLKNREKDGLNDEKYESKLTKLLDAYKGKGFYKNLASFTQDTINESKEDRIAEEVEGARDMGYPMLLCRDKNPYSYVRTIAEPSNVRPSNDRPSNVQPKKKRRTGKGGDKQSSLLNIIVHPNIGGRKKKRTKKKAPKKRHRKSKKARKSKKKNSWCKSSKSWCKYTKKNNCKKGLWSKKTKLGRASRKWCKVTKRWCKVNDKTCKKRR